MRFLGVTAMLLIACSFITSSFAQPVNPAAPYSGNDLYAMCLAAPFGAQEYAIGIADIAAIQKGAFNMTFCPPTNVELTQYGAVACDFVENHPESRQVLGSVLVMSAFAAAWPCR